MTFRSLIAAMFIFAVALGTTAQAQEKAPMLVGGQLELCLPMGEYADKVETGFGFVGNFQYGLQPRLWLVGTLGYESFAYKNEGQATLEGSDGSFFIHAGARYDLSEGEGFVPYVGVKLGLHFWSSTLSQKTFTGTIEYSTSGQAIGLSPMFGVIYPITESIKLDAALKYSLLVRDKKEGNDATFFALQAGVLIPLNL
jgi:opacity protein-like surface antigen